MEEITQIGSSKIIFGEEQFVNYFNGRKPVLVRREDMYMALPIIERTGKFEPVIDGTPLSDMVRTFAPRFEFRDVDPKPQNLMASTPAELPQTRSEISVERKPEHLEEKITRTSSLNYIRDNTPYRTSYDGFQYGSSILNRINTFGRRRYY